MSDYDRFYDGLFDYMSRWGIGFAVDGVIDCLETVDVLDGISDDEDTNE